MNLPHGYEVGSLPPHAMDYNEAIAIIKRRRAKQSRFPEDVDEADRLIAEKNATETMLVSLTHEEQSHLITLLDILELAPVLLGQMQMSGRDPDWDCLAKDIDNAIERLKALLKSRGRWASKADHPGMNPH